MKKNSEKTFLKAFVTVAAFLVIFWQVPVMAIDLGGGLARDTAKNAGYDAAGTTDTTFAATLGSIVKAVLSFVGVIFLILMVYAGFLWMTARGEEDKVTQAEKIIRSAIIGLIITTGAYSITAFVLPRILSRTSGAATPDGSIFCCERGGVRTIVVSGAECAPPGVLAQVATASACVR